MLASCPLDLGLVLWADAGGGGRLGASTHADVDMLSMGNVAPRSPRLWAHFGSVLWKTAVALRCLQRYSAWVAARQEAWAGVERAGAAETYTLLVSDVPPHCAAPAAADAALRSFWPGAFLGATPVVDCADLEALAADRVAAQSVAEEAAWAEAHAAAGARRQLPSRLCGLRSSLDAQAAAAAVAALEQQLREMRRAALARAPCDGMALRPALFVAFHSAHEAALAAGAAGGEAACPWTVQRLGPPEDVYWPNVGRLSRSQRATAAAVGGAATAAAAALLVAPLVVVQGAAAASNVARLLPALAPALSTPAAAAVVEGLLPGVLLMLLAAPLPAAMWWLAAAEGGTSVARLGALHMRKLFAVGAASMAASLAAGSSLNSLCTPTDLAAALSSAIPQSSRFFMTLLLLAGPAGAAASSGRALPALRYWALTRFWVRTRRGRAAAWTPAAAPANPLLAEALLAFALAVAFSTLQPVMFCVLLIPFCNCFLFCVLQPSLSVCHIAGDAPGGDPLLWLPRRRRQGAAALCARAVAAGPRRRLARRATPRGLWPALCAGADRHGDGPEAGARAGGAALRPGDAPHRCSGRQAGCRP